jgi:hypothetical protein
LAAMHSLGKRIQLGATPSEGSNFVAVCQHRNRASAQAGFISQLRRGQHSGLRGICMPATTPPRSSLRISFVKNSCRSITGWRLQFSLLA